MKLDHLRVHYDRGALDEAHLNPDPFAQFAAWMKDACDAGLTEPNAMTLATVDAHHRPFVRTVLLKGFDARGFVFYTNLESRKAAHLTANAEAALLFPWLPLHRQVAINGVTERVPTTEALAYFASRPFASQLGAWASPQSKVISTRALLEEKWAEAKRKFKEGHVPMPSFWGGFRIVPHSIEFWQGREHRLHDRFLYTRTPATTANNDAAPDSTPGPWSLQRLAP